MYINVIGCRTFEEERRLMAERTYPAALDAYDWARASRSMFHGDTRDDGPDMSCRGEAGGR